MALGLTFLIVKVFEYKDKFDHHHVPGYDFHVDAAHAGIAGPMEIFFALLHDDRPARAHMIIGFGLMSVITWMAYSDVSRRSGIRPSR